MIRKNVAEILRDHVTFELEAIDRMYLNAYVPSLQTGAGFAYFVKTHMGARVPSTMTVAPMSERFVRSLERFVAVQGLDLVTFEKGQRKDDLAQQYLAAFEGEEGVLFVGKAQETASVFRTEKRRDAHGTGRPDQMQLLFNRRVTRRTPGRFRTRIVTEGVVPSLHVDYKKARIKQYHKEGQALRTETTINNTYDFVIGRALHHLPALREIGFTANRRLLHVESLSHDCLIGEDHLDAVCQPVVVQHQRAAGLRFGDRRVLALMQTRCLFAVSPTGVRHREVRDAVAQLRGGHADRYGASQTTYDLRRLRLHRLIERVPDSHRYRITERGAQIAMLYVRLHARGFRPAASLPTRGSTRGQRAFEHLNAALTHFLQEVRLVA